MIEETEVAHPDLPSGGDQPERRKPRSEEVRMIGVVWGVGIRVYWVRRTGSIQ